MKRLSAVAAVVALVAIARTARPLVPEAERLTGADLPAKHLIFTFDQGPSTTTPDLSAYLKQHGIHATFFIDARYIEMEPAIQALIADGHLVGNRAATNRDLANVVPLEDVAAELMVTDELIAPFVPWNRKFFRAPFGKWTRDQPPTGDAGDLDAVFHTLEKTTLNSYIGPIFWNIDTDCFELGAQECSDAYLERVHARGNGIIRFDDTEQIFAAIKLLVPQLETEKYVFDALDAPPAVAALLSKCDATCGGCTGPAPNDCNQCQEGARLVDGQCLACTVCKPGNYVAKACAAEADTLCAPCAADGYQPAPGSLSCLACGDCDDKNACTTDSCDPTLGCTHTKISGCPAVDASIPPQNLPDAGGSSTNRGGKIDDENNIAVSADEDEGCSIGASRGSRTGSLGWSAFVVALCIAKIRRSVHRRERNRPLFL